MRHLYCHTFSLQRCNVEPRIHYLPSQAQHEARSELNRQPYIIEFKLRYKIVWVPASKRTSLKSEKAFRFEPWKDVRESSQGVVRAMQHAFNTTIKLVLPLKSLKSKAALESLWAVDFRTNTNLLEYFKVERTNENVLFYVKIKCINIVQRKLSIFIKIQPKYKKKIQEKYKKRYKKDTKK